MSDNKKINNSVELHDEELDQVVGGGAYINANTSKIAFDTIDEVYKYKNCTYQEIRNLCESFIGKYATEAEFDAACVAALKEKGWI